MRYHLPLLFCFVLFGWSLSGLAQTGTIRGKVTDGTTGEVLLGATVRVLQGGQVKGGAYSDLEGSFTSKVPAGTYTVLTSYISYITDTAEVTVTAGQVVLSDVLLFEESTVREDLAVTITAKRNEASDVAFQAKKQNSINAIDGVTFDLVQRTGDNNVAAAMQRVVGVTVTDGKYVYVRGLGDRYSKTLLNGVQIPGLDPDRNTVQMDIFPANLIDNVVVIKNFTPDLPGDFSGGLIDIITKDFPNQFTVGASASLGYNPQANLNDAFLTYETGNRDWTGFDDGTRAIPDAITEQREAGFDFSQVNQFTRDPAVAQVVDATSSSFSTGFTPYEGRSDLDQAYQFNIGDQKALGNGNIGYIFGVSYRNTYEYHNNRVENRYSVDDSTSEALVPIRLLNIDGIASEHNVIWGAIGKISYKSPNHKVSLDYMRNQSLSDNAIYLNGTYPEGPQPSDTTQIEFYQTRAIRFSQRAVNVFQLSGKSNFGRTEDGQIRRGVQVGWAASYAPSRLSEPDVRFFANGYEFPSFQPGQEAQDTSWQQSRARHILPGRFYREMTEDVWNGKLDLMLPFQQWNGLDAEVKFGGNVSWRTRDYEETRFFFPRSNVPFDGRPDNLLLPQYIGVTDTSGSASNPLYFFGTYLQDGSLAQNSYDAHQLVLATYGMITLPITPRFKVITGLRYERTDAMTDPRDSSTVLAITPIVTNGDTTGFDSIQQRRFPAGILDLNDFLPALTLIYSPTDKMNVRFSGYRTLARPSFREFSSLITFDFNGDYEQWGNSNLKRTIINSYDIRWEWFPSYNEIASASFFYKDFTNPIEKAVVSATQNPYFQYRNVGDATAYGLELEFRKNFAFLSEALRNLQISGNASFIISEVTIDSAEYRSITARDPLRPRTRPLFGQSPYTINGEIAYVDPEIGLSTSLSYNVFGPRLVLVGVNGTPDVYEQPRGLLNLSISKEFGRFKIRLRANNLLNPEYQFLQPFSAYSRDENRARIQENGEYVTVEEDYLFRSYTKGRSFSVGLSFKL
jgi:TonB-dependent receptor